MVALLLLPLIWSSPPRGLPPGAVDRRALREIDPAVLWCRDDGRLAVLSDPTRFRATYPAGGVGPRKSGASFLVELPPRDTATLTYRVRFDEGFDFVRGGKLPGLAGGTATTGKDPVTGDGWSARFMWRRRGDLVLYLYHLDQPKDYGEDFATGVRMVPGRWYQIRQRVTVNTPGVRDGRIEVWIDGRSVLDLDDVRLRTGDAAPVDRFYFSTFHGGSGRRWAPSKTQGAEFADIRVE